MVLKSRILPVRAMNAELAAAAATESEAGCRLDASECVVHLIHLLAHRLDPVLERRVRRQNHPRMDAHGGTDLGRDTDPKTAHKPSETQPPANAVGSTTPPAAQLRRP